MQNLTLIIPAKSENESLPTFLSELKKFECKKLIIIQENDIDTKNSIVEDENTKIIFQKINGYGAAIIEGINNSKTEFSCIINADGSMNPDYLQLMLENCNDKDLVFASRYLKPNGGSEDDTILTFIGNKIFKFLDNLFYNLKLSDILFTYIIGKTASFKNLDLKSYDFRLCVELPIKAKQKKYIYSSLGCYERKRIAGKKKVNEFKDGFLILYAIFRYLI